MQAYLGTELVVLEARIWGVLQNAMPDDPRKVKRTAPRILEVVNPLWINRPARNWSDTLHVYGTREVTEPRWLVVG